MNVAELIATLQTLDPSLPVFTVDAAERGNFGLDGLWLEPVNVEVTGADRTGLAWYGRPNAPDKVVVL